MGMLKENSKLTNGTTSNSSSKASSARFFCKKCKVRVGSKSESDGTKECFFFPHA